jgi:hypothetical protein
MAQQRRIIKNKISRREQERRDARKAAEKTSFSTIAMRVFIILLLTATIMGLAIQIIVYK